MGEIAPGVHRIDGLKRGRFFAQVYLLVDGDVLALVDAGLLSTVHTIARYVEGMGKSIDQLRYILLTHSHPDHTAGAPALQERSRASVLAHANDVQHSGERPSVSYMGLFGTFALPLLFLRRVPANGLLGDGDMLPLLDGLRVVHTPGHTPGSVCFYLEKRGVLFSGDMILEDHGVLGMNRHGFPGSHLKDYRASLDYSVLCPGHGEPVRERADRCVRALLEGEVSYGLSWRVFGRGTASLGGGRTPMA